ncbi:MAG: Rieske 2Fe-2S domain-containing protein [Desulfobacteraceae bacterium]|nr:Rieske 2Fe-2S domain-containing protein [Desulfobacteraceae bacterium]MBC2751660.1 Rieske 2Fe-2S domain-containing protein [Desulfobacteraceae bacterium]
MKWLKRIFGISETPLPGNDAGWNVANQSITIDLNQMPELASPGSAVRLEGKGLPVRTLVVHGKDGDFHAFANRCTHMGRRIDILPGTDHIECCSVSKSTFDYGGQPLGGAAKKPLRVFAVTLSDNELTIQLT